ncbi:MAG: DUF4335 domain-containing protein [Nostocales cyanobacterium]|nr:MAG: DUF4335 domain-containing protein [Nostocales cyanobacterium]TAF21439.1 MAG: DUF4335 domain-containing protein [Nostocales cyanobacterium]
MPGSNSVIRRYTPPTCTLEILAQSSPLSRWMGKTVLNQLRFQLHFDDPTLPEENKITIQGDRDQIEALCHAVTNYVQELLQKSADNFCLTSLESQPSTKTSPEAELSNQDQPELTDPQTTPANKSKNTTGMGILEATIYLEAAENLTHKLYLGSLANQTTGSIIQLSLLQLFDLASALDEYATDVITLPNLNDENSDSKPVFTLPAWTPVAAMIVLALGLTPLTWQYANNIKNNQPKTAKNTPSTPEQVALEPSPFAGLETAKNIPNPASNSNSINLPNLDSVTPLPQSNTIPTPLLTPDVGVAPPIQIPPRNTENIPRISQPVIPPILPPTSTANAQKSATEIIQSARISGENKSRNLPSQISPSSYKIPESVTKFPNDLETLTIDNVSSLPQPQLNGDNNSLDTANNLQNSNDLVSRLRSSKITTQPTKLAAEENKLFDSPQVAEARTFLQKNWQPPAGLSETLEYSLILGVDGTIERILPLNKAARDFVDNTGLPEIGKPFVSTNKAGQNLKLRAVFSPDGKVKTFVEKQ